MTLVQIISLLWLFILTPYVEGQSATSSIQITSTTMSNCIDNSKISQTVTLTSIVVFVCFLAELVGIGLLLFRARRNQRHITYEHWPPDDHPAASSSTRDSKVDVEVPSTRRRYLSAEKRLPVLPSWFSDEEPDDLDSVNDVVVEPASPLIHAQFSATPFSGTPRTSIFPGSPTPSSNFFAVRGRESWVGGNDPDRVTLFRTPSHLPQPSPGDYLKTISMSAVHEGIDSPLGTAESTEVFALQQLVAKLKGRVQELERQNKLLQDGRWLKTAPPGNNGR
ncbi:hypothetical protein C8F04DRAFT_1389570 [Mycena alexandri]|uniref:Transmembrane protein n=1 Tax=Mycena alexandri TaxID=1745969 RepID=A0AAD6TF42_9AGAR|nr:hypothetical protein C8F04DRAFT_1389570 [Mycena alexandri]